MTDATPSRYAISLQALERTSRVAPEDQVEEMPDDEAPTELYPPLPNAWTAGFNLA